MDLNGPVSITALRADGYSSDGKCIVISVNVKYSQAVRKYCVPIECLYDLVVDLRRLQAEGPRPRDQPAVALDAAE